MRVGRDRHYKGMALQQGYQQTTAATYKHMQEETSKMRPAIVYVSVQVCKQEITSVVHELHPSARVKGLYAGNISSQQGAAASCSTLSSLTTAKYCSYRAPRAQHSLSHCNLQSLHPKDHQSCCSAHHPPHL